MDFKKCNTKIKESLPSNLDFSSLPKIFETVANYDSSLASKQFGRVLKLISFKIKITRFLPNILWVFCYIALLIFITPKLGSKEVLQDLPLGLHNVFYEIPIEGVPTDRATLIAFHNLFVKINSTIFPVIFLLASIYLIKLRQATVLKRIKFNYAFVLYSFLVANISGVPQLGLYKFIISAKLLSSYKSYKLKIKQVPDALYKRILKVGVPIIVKFDEKGVYTFHDGKYFLSSVKCSTNVEELVKIAERDFFTNLDNEYDLDVITITEEEIIDLKLIRELNMELTNKYPAQFQIAQ